MTVAANLLEGPTFDLYVVVPMFVVWVVGCVVYANTRRRR